MPANLNVAGTWRNIGNDSMWTRVSGTWRPVDTGFVNVSGTWRTFYQRDQIPPAAVVGASAAFNVPGSGTSVTASWTNPADSDISFVRVAWYINAPGTPVSTVDVSGTPSQARTATFTTGSVTSNIFIQLTPYDTSGNAGPTTQINPGSIRTSPPNGFFAPSYLTSFSTVSLVWSAPTFGTVTNYTVEQRTNAGALISSVTTSLTNQSFSIAEDTIYKFYLIANSVGGSTPYGNPITLTVGHSELGYYAPVYGWDTNYQTSLIGPIYNSTPSASGFPNTNLNDNGFDTPWVSNGAFEAGGGTGWEGFQFAPNPGGTRKLRQITLRGMRVHKYWLTKSGANPGINTIGSPGRLASGYPGEYLSRDEIASSQESTDPTSGSEIKTLNVDAYEIVLSSLSWLQVTVSNLLYFGGNYKAIIYDVWIDWYDQIQTGTTWVVTRSYVGNNIYYGP